MSREGRTEKGLKVCVLGSGRARTVSGSIDFSAVRVVAIAGHDTCLFRI